MREATVSHADSILHTLCSRRLGLNDPAPRSSPICLTPRRMQSADRHPRLLPPHLPPAIPLSSCRITQSTVLRGDNLLHAPDTPPNRPYEDVSNVRQCVWQRCSGEMIPCDWSPSDRTARQPAGPHIYVGLSVARRWTEPCVPHAQSTCGL